ncbi:MAG: glycosyltransferase family 2 protein [Chthonomonadales bacterium]|nr:glycosyltransferase family 2 protein [Chthonomonadales bacterium]
MAEEPVTLSIVIVNWNTCGFLVNALASIYEHAPSEAFEVIVVDNSSSDGSAEAVAERFPQVELIRNSANEGYAKGNNMGLARASGQFVLLLNPDVIVLPGTLDRAVAYLREHPDVGAIGARQIGADDVVQRSVRGFPTPLAVASEALGLSRLFPNSRMLSRYRMNWFTYDREMDVDQPMGTFLMISRDALSRVGHLDERFPIFFNEVDWCYRAKQAGFRIVFVPEVSIIHYGGASTRLVAAEMAWESRRGLLAYYRKHYRAAYHWPVYALAAATSWLHAWYCSSRRRREGS